MGPPALVAVRARRASSAAVHNATNDGPAAHGRPFDLRRPLRVVLVPVLLLLCAAIATPGWLQASTATSRTRVVVVVGPVGGLNATYRAEAREVIDEARRYTTNVVVLMSPKATWARVKEAAQGASVLVYFGHGWGFPSRYTPYDPARQNGMALDPASGANGTRRVYYGEDRVRRSIRLAPRAAVLLYRLCYASGNTEPHLAEGTLSQSKRRVDGFGAGFLAAGAGIVIADGHPKAPRNFMRQLFTTDRTMVEVFRRAPNFHDHELGPYASTRTPGARYVLDPDHGGRDPSGFYRSLVGDLELRTTTVTNRLPPATPEPEPTGTPPGDGPTAPPDPTPTLEPTEPPPATPEPTAATPEPTPEPAEDPTPAVTPDPAPTASPAPEPTPMPDGTPEPTAGPAATPDPSATP